jgi:hypothetical protein
MLNPTDPKDAPWYSDPEYDRMGKPLKQKKELDPDADLELLWGEEGKEDA